MILNGTAPFIGLDISYEIKKINLLGSFEYHWFDYEAEADWNLRSDLAHPISFRHHAEGNGFTAHCGVEYLFSKNWAFNLSFSYRDWEADEDGVDVISLSNGQGLAAKLNDVDWESYVMSLGVVYRF